jgi:hypothetical protein
MKKDQWEEWIRSKMTDDRIEPASESFYHRTWSRIRTTTPASTVYGLSLPLTSIGTACWRSVPVCAALLLIIAVYGWFYPPDFSGPVSETSELYVMDANAVPSGARLFYQIMNTTSQASEPETEP